MDEKNRGRSEIAEFFFNETDYREGSGSEIIVCPHLSNLSDMFF